MNTPKPTAPQSTVVGNPIPLPNEGGLMRDSLKEYVENDSTEWIMPNPDANDGGFGGLFQFLAVNIVFIFLFILIRIVAALIGV